jgi:radical SAM superfamily enzyme YgiQ (UPF0313 family)
MREAGCEGINLGVETGDPEVLRTEAKVGLTHEVLAQVVEWAHAVGIKIHFLLMVGLPGETRRSLVLTHRLVSELRPDSIGVTIVTPYPGTPLHEEAKRKKWIESTEGVTIVTPYPGTPLHEEAKRKKWIESTEWREFGGQTAVIHTDHLTSSDLQYGRKVICKLFDLGNSGAWMDRRRFRTLSEEFRKWAEESPVKSPCAPIGDRRPRETEV